MKGIFITGTDTGVGKTFFTTLLTKALREQGIPALPLKPISCGDREDSIHLSEATGGAISPIEINPIHFAAPLSPYAASILEVRPFPWAMLRERMQKLSSNYSGPFLVEGVGGWRVPFDQSSGVREWAQELALPVLLVVRATLGTLNHTLLTVDSIRQAKLPLLGIILNLHQAPDDLATQTNPALLEGLTGLPLLQLPASLPELPSPIPSWLIPC
jgi:dethiobiotin synthetase